MQRLPIILTGTVPSTVKDFKIPYLGAAWLGKRILVLLPPTHIKRRQDWVSLNYLGEIISAIKAQVTERNPLWKLVPRRWRIYVCHLGTVSLIDLKKMEFELLEPARLQPNEVRQFVEAKIAEQPPF